MIIECRRRSLSHEGGKVVEENMYSMDHACDFVSSCYKKKRKRKTRRNELLFILCVITSEASETFFLNTIQKKKKKKKVARTSYIRCLFLNSLTTLV